MNFKIKKRSPDPSGDATVIEPANEAAAEEEAAVEEEREPEVSELIAQSASLAADYGDGFDLTRELADPEIRRLLGAGLSIREAYEFRHREEIAAKAAREIAREEVRRAWEELVASGRLSGRPGMASVAGREAPGATAQERAALERRAMKGEKIRF